MEEPRKESVEEPTNTEQDAREAESFMAREWSSIALVSIAGMLLLALGMMQATGLVDFLDVLGGATVQWLAIAVLGIAVVAAFLWSRRGV